MKNILLPVAALSAAFLASCGKDTPPKKADDSPAARVSVITVSPAARPGILEATGTVRARTEATISARVMGAVREVSVQVGDRVRAGQQLAVIDSRDMDAQLRQAEAGMAEARSAQPEVAGAIAAAKAQQELAQATFRRMKELFDKKSISNQEFDEAAARVKVAESHVRMAEAKKQQLDDKIRQAEQGVGSANLQRGYAEVAAPFAGRVTRRMVEPGNMASPGLPLLMIEQDAGYRLEAAVEESRLGAVRRGQAVEVTLDAFAKTLSGRVSEIVPAVDSASRSFIVKIDLPPAADLRSGLFGRARFPLGEQMVLAVPAAAVVTHGQLETVFVAEDGRARNRLVTLGSRMDGQVEVLSGLRAGDLVIHPAPKGLVDGARVEVTR